MRRWWVWATAAAALGVAGLFWLPRLIQRVEAPIVVGLVHSLTGPLAVAESAMLDAEILALEEINAAGGLLGRRLVWKEADARSDPQEFGREARRLVESEKADLIVGGLTSASRRAMMGAIQSSGVLLIHAGLFEGMESSTDWFGIGPLPNQQAVPAVSWCVDALRAKRFFLAGAADVSSYAVHAVVRDQLKALGCEVAGEGFVGVDGSGAGELVAAMKGAGADVAISSIVGDANADFFKQMAAAGLTADKLPVVCLRVSEDDLRRLPPDETAGHYAAWAYFQSLGDEGNRRFVERFKARYGADRTTSDPSASAYYAVKLWAQAVEEAEAIVTGEVLEHLSRQSVEAGADVISVDHDMIHAWRPFRLGKIRRDGQIEQLLAMDRPIRPVAYPVFRPKSTWRAALAKWRSTGKPGLDEPAPPTPASAAAAAPPRPVVWGPRGAVRPPAAAPSPLRSAVAPRPGPR